MHPQYIRAPSKNLAPHLWRLHHLKIKMIRIINGEAEREEAQRRGEGKRRARGAGWTPSRQGARGVSGPPRAIAARPRPAIFGDGSREHLRASPREASPPPPLPPPLRAAPRRAPFWQGAVSAEAARGRHRARERGAASLLPPAPPRPRPPLPAPARPPARPASRIGKPVWTKTQRPLRRDRSVWFPILCTLKMDLIRLLTPASRTGSSNAHTATLVCPQAPRTERERAHECLHRGNVAAKSLHARRKVGCASVRSAARHHPPPAHGVRSE